MAAGVKRRLLGAAAAWLLAAHAAAQDGVAIDIAAGRLWPQAGSEAAAREITLPYSLYRDARLLERYVFEARFELPHVPERAMLLLPGWPDGGTIAINGTEVADVATSTPQTVARHLQPFAFVVPRGVLREGANVLRMHWASRETLVRVPPLRVGARERLEPLHAWQRFWSLTVLQISLAFAAGVAVITLGLWWARRGDAAAAVYRLIGASAAGWILVNAMLLWSSVPAAWFVWRRAFGYVGIGMFALGMWVCLVRLAGARLRAYDRACAAWLAFGGLMLPLGHAYGGATHLPRVESAWAVGAGLLGVVPLVVLARAARRTPSARSRLLLAFVVVGLGLAAAEVAAFLFGDPIATVHASAQLLAPLWLATACGLLVQDFLHSVQLAERNAAAARLRELEHAHAAEAERRRIMQDMHDGLGSQLVSSLALAERGELGAAQTAELLRGCIDDLRLAVDTLTDDLIDLSLAAGNLRFRMEPRLRAAGVRLRWDMSALPETLALPGTLALPLLRVLQEALANAIKHAQASRVSVRLACHGDAPSQRLRLEVADDGRGFDPAHAAPGKGLAGMHRRARALGAELVLASGAQGTRVQLEMPLPAGAA